MLDPRPTDPLTGRQLLSAMLVCLGVIFLLLALSGCSTDPQDGSGAACGRQALPGTQPPPTEQVRAAMEEGWADAVYLCPPAAADTFRPAVAWKMSDFWIDNAISAPGGPAHGTCASGVAWLAAGEIWISLAEAERVLPLVRWESKNMALLRAPGCGWQAYRRVP